MTKHTAGSTAKFRQGAQDLLDRRGMASTPNRLGPKPRAGLVTAGAGRTHGDAFRHIGRDATSSGVHSAPPVQGELKGHRHRGAEKHSAH
ncbi:hypothetical protein ACFV1W_34110 [Kitasatospora sp. NPDC059648]|uniref:hypothetical protein n=1 Tax=Kitasatospora sp. NPDC059648 TaxID=3346894 RepID=UPI0036BB1F9B